MLLLGGHSPGMKHLKNSASATIFLIPVIDILIFQFNEVCVLVKHFLPPARAFACTWAKFVLSYAYFLL